MQINWHRLTIDRTRRGFQETIAREYAASRAKANTSLAQLAASDRLIDRWSTGFTG